MARELHDDFYQRLRGRVRDWAKTKEGRTSEVTEFILLAPDLFHLLVRLSLDPDVPVVEKAKVGAALAYFLSPIDLLPEALVGPVGYLDDVGLAVLVVHSILEKTDKSVVTRHWAGEGDLLDATRRFLDRADDLLGAGLWQRVKNVVERTTDGVRHTATNVRERAAKRSPKKAEAAKKTPKAAGKGRTVAKKTPKRATKGASRKASKRVAKKRAAKKRTAKKAAKKRTAKKRSAKSSGPQGGAREGT